MSDWISGWVSYLIYKSVIGLLSELVSELYICRELKCVCEWINGWVVGILNEWARTWLSWVSVWVNERVFGGDNEWIIEWMSEWISE